MSKSPIIPPEYYDREQTLVKHIILRGYLERVAYNILSFSDDFTFVDGFSGPWEARSEVFDDTSFGIAIKELRKIKGNFANRNQKKRVRCVFVEREEEPFERLKKSADEASDLQARAIQGNFEDNIDAVRGYVGTSFALTFVDPTGWNIDLIRLAPLLRQKGEVLVNFMYEHFKRFVEDEREGVRASYDRPFGGLDWREVIAEKMSAGLDKEAAILEAFKLALKQVCGFKYVASARIRHRRINKSHFYLVYGTRHEKGLEEFRKVEREALNAEESFRIDAKDRKFIEAGQDNLFGSMPHAGHEIAEAHWAAEIFRARQECERMLAQKASVRFEDLACRLQERFSVLLPEIKDLLVDMERAGTISFEGLTGRQWKPRKGVILRATAPAN